MSSSVALTESRPALCGLPVMCLLRNSVCLLRSPFCRWSRCREASGIGKAVEIVSSECQPLDQSVLRILAGGRHRREETAG
jgi:hypothetical protein